MMSRVKELADRYGIKTHIDILELFATEIYGDGVKAGVERDANAALRDHFAGLAMQGSGGDTHKAIADESYMLADAMLEAREVGNE